MTHSSNASTNGALHSTHSSTGSSTSASSSKRPSAGHTTKGKLDPYAPIEKRRLIAYDGMKSAGHTVRMEDPSSPSGWRECGVVSGSYLLVENSDVRDLAREVAERSGLGFEVKRTFFDGKRYGLYLATTERELVEVSEGDALGIGLAFTNSYDGSQRLTASLYVHRLACENGMIVPELLGRVAVRHDPSGVHWETEVARALAVVEQAPAGLARFAQAARALQSMRLSASRLRELRTEVLPALPVTLWGQTVDRLLQHEELSGWGLLNAATNVLWHAERPTAATFGHNEYVTSRLVDYAVGSN